MFEVEVLFKACPLGRPLNLTVRISSSTSSSIHARDRFLPSIGEPKCRNPAFLLTSIMANTQKSLAIRAIDLIFSCTICQETLSSIYSSAEGDGDRGLHRSGDPQSGRVTKLWLTECAHLTCAKHLQGGGDLTLVSSFLLLLALTQHGRRSLSR